jgi:hypothetical protein
MKRLDVVQGGQGLRDSSEPTRRKESGRIGAQAESRIARPFGEGLFNEGCGKVFDNYFFNMIENAMSNKGVETEIRSLEDRYEALKTIFSDDERGKKSLEQERVRTLVRMISLQRKLLVGMMQPEEPLL